ncbi:hypothetical protein CJ030_MR3G017000 [Morella rubra]|uniref:Uncharacterized protein n=1 Tax=Morella rubra TaxID=262757 RepID=A0A6A1W785_9ROSI|nr:hypothetical protein CJ030_MR3G017000 [Morella rubra]
MLELPDGVRVPNNYTAFMNKIADSDTKSYGVLVDSFYENNYPKKNKQNGCLKGLGKSAYGKQQGSGHMQVGSTSGDPRAPGNWWVRDTLRVELCLRKHYSRGAHENEPIGAEQIYNDKLVTRVLRIGVKVGAES